nr:reverse transcriptase domain-containing protein [Tanacetum cinerariifolium]
KDLLHACPHHGFTELHQLDTVYNALNPADQDSLNSATGGNLLERRTQYVMTIIENKSKCMRTRSSSNLPCESSPNPTTSNPKRRNRRRSKQPFILEESPVDTMVDQRIMAELLRAPTEGYAEAIVVLSILAEQFELKYNLINMMTSDQFFGLEKYNPHDHIHLLRACPHHGFTKLHQIHTFYNALNPTDQDSLNFAAGDNLLEKSTQDVLTIIKNKSKVRNSRNKSIVSQVKSSDANASSSEIAKLTRAVNQQTSAVTTTMTAIFKQFQVTPPPAFVKAVEKFMLLVVMLIRIISVSPPVATLFQNFEIIFKDTLQQP